MKAAHACALAISAILPLTAADTVSGKWQVYQNISGNESTQNCTFTQTGSELTGTCVGAAGTKLQITGKAEEKKISWSYKSEYNGTPLTVNYLGTLETGKITGTVTVPEFSVDGPFTATLEK